MCDGQNEHALRLKLERDEVRELLEKGLSNWSRSGFRPRPDWIESRRSFETFQDSVDSRPPDIPARYHSKIDVLRDTVRT